ncbi:MAG TPA: sigma-54 dependent transcriptional regulator [Polyangiaceae bacterium]|nr:sigma-54 dependent transcriptional regulator [Polyangiaceae bacterium]
MQEPAEARILLVSADLERVRRHLDRLSGVGYVVRTCAPNADGQSVVEQFDPLVTVVDVGANGHEATEFLDRGRRAHPSCGFITIPSAGDAGEVGGAEPAANGSEAAAPHEASDVLSLVERALERSRKEREALRFKNRADAILSQARFDEIIGSHPSMQNLLKKVAQVAKTRANVLILGESGTGKELIAASLHQNSKRHAARFIKLNCAALSESVLESELFGHEKGAFTGAVSRREGRFEQANGGTLFLDEISEVPPAVQIKLLRFLQEREFERVGGNETLKVDVRIVAATNKDLMHLVNQGRFREDLYYRLNVVRIVVPPLRARHSDVLRLAEHFLRRAAAENEVEVLGFTDAAKTLMTNYPWPGNVRELQNTVEQAVVLTETGWVDADDLPIRAEPKTAEPPLKLVIPGSTLAEIERYAITETLKAVGGSTTRAAEVLGISRRTVQYRVREWGLGAATQADSDSDLPPSELERDPS